MAASDLEAALALLDTQITAVTVQLASGVDQYGIEGLSVRRQKLGDLIKARTLLRDELDAAGLSEAGPIEIRSRAIPS